MAKGQLRSNREAKKPKKKKVAEPVSALSKAAPVSIGLPKKKG